MAVHGILQPQNMQEKEDTMKYMSGPLQMVARQITSSMKTMTAKLTMIAMAAMTFKLGGNPWK